MKQTNEKKTVAGKYIVFMSKILGQGAFATTYLCKLKTDANKVLACKLMNKDQISKVLDDVSYIMNRVKDQVGSWKELDHPNIVKFEGCEETKNNIYFFLEYCPDGTLQTYIKKHKFGVNIEQNIQYSKQLVKACTYLQSKNIVHRDIKPENILIKGDQIKLADFGLARAIKSDDDKHMQSFFTFAGTLHYMAPEIIKCEKYPYKCDVWSVGITIFMMFTGELPFGMILKDNSEKVILDKIYHKKEEFKHPVFSKIQQIVKILSLMLNPNASERLTMKQIDAEFERI